MPRITISLLLLTVFLCQGSWAAYMPPSLPPPPSRMYTTKVQHISAVPLRENDYCANLDDILPLPLRVTLLERIAKLAECSPAPTTLQEVAERYATHHPTVVVAINTLCEDTVSDYSRAMSFLDKYPLRE